MERGRAVFLDRDGVINRKAREGEYVASWSQFAFLPRALDGLRDAILDGDGLTAMGDELWPLVVIGTVSIPLGLWVFRRGEQYAKRHGKLKRSG